MYSVVRALALLVLTFSAPAFAQATSMSANSCNDGMVDTDDHCCWPGQSWSEERERCVGTPSCPDGWRARGSLCVRGDTVNEATRTDSKDSTSATSPTVVKEETRAQPEAEMPAVVSAEQHDRVPPDTAPLLTRLKNGERIEFKGGPIPPGTKLQSKRNMELAKQGMVTVGLGYALTATVALLKQKGRSDGCGPGNLGSLVPLAGIPIFIGRAATGSDCQFSAVEWAGPAMQALGASVIVAGLLNRVQYLVLDESQAANEASLSLAPNATTALGLNLTGRF